MNIHCSTIHEILHSFFPYDIGNNHVITFFTHIIILQEIPDRLSNVFLALANISIIKEAKYRNKCPGVILSSPATPTCCLYE